MAQSSFPFGSSQIATEDQWSQMFRMIAVDGVFATAPFGTDLKVTGSNTSTIAVDLGEAWVQGTYYKNDAPLNVPVPTNAGSATARKDLVVLRRDPAVDSVTVQYKTGSIDTPPLLQVLNGVWEIPLARVTVDPGASVVSPAGVVDQRWFIGRPVVFGNSQARRAPVQGQLLVEDKTVYLGNGIGWDKLATAGQDTGWKKIKLASGYTTHLDTPEYRVKDGMVYCRGNARRSSGADLVGFELTTIAKMPSEAIPNANVRYGVAPTEHRTINDSSTRLSFFSARLEVQSDGEVKYWLPDYSPSEWIGFDSFVYSL